MIRFVIWEQFWYTWFIGIRNRTSDSFISLSYAKKLRIWISDFWYMNDQIRLKTSFLFIGLNHINLWPADIWSEADLKIIITCCFRIRWVFLFRSSSDADHQWSIQRSEFWSEFRRRRLDRFRRLTHVSLTWSCSFSIHILFTWTGRNRVLSHF